jgi:zinc finger protein
MEPPKGAQEELEGEICPFCHSPNLILREEEVEVPYFGKIFLFSMTCKSCKYHKSDVEAAEPKPHARYTLDITSEEDMKIRVVRSSEGTIKIPRIGSIEPGAAANGYVTNVEGVLTRIKDQLEHLKEDSEEEEDVKNKARSMIKKINRVIWGQESIKLVVEDPTGNSAIVSDKAVKTKL